MKCQCCGEFMERHGLGPVELTQVIESHIPGVSYYCLNCGWEYLPKLESAYQNRKLLDHVNACVKTLTGPQAFPSASSQESSYAIKCQCCFTPMQSHMAPNWWCPNCGWFYYPDALDKPHNRRLIEHVRGCVKTKRKIKQKEPVA